jgi:hypothetical protein
VCDGKRILTLLRRRRSWQRRRERNGRKSWNWVGWIRITGLQLWASNGRAHVHTSTLQNCSFVPRSRLSVPTKLPLRMFWIVGFLIKLILECTFWSGIVFQFFFIFRKLQSEINKSWNVHFKVTFFFQIFLYFGSYNLKLTKFGLYLSNLFLFRIVASKLSRVQNQRYFWIFGSLRALWGPKKQFSTLYLTIITYL